MLAPLTKDTKTLTELIDKNQEDTWHEWGEDVAGIIRATKLVIDSISAPAKSEPESFRNRLNKATSYDVTEYFPDDGETHSLFDYFIECGKRDIKRQQTEKAKTGFGVGLGAVNRKDFLVGVSCLAFLQDQNAIEILFETCLNDLDAGVRESAIWAYAFLSGNIKTLAVEFRKGEKNKKVLEFLAKIERRNFAELWFI